MSTAVESHYPLCGRTTTITDYPDEGNWAASLGLIERRGVVALLLIGLAASAAVLAIPALHLAATRIQIILALIPVIALQVSHGPRPPEHRWMIFVDGENLTIRTQELAANMGIT